MHDCIGIKESMDIIFSEYGLYDFPEEFWLSKIAEDKELNIISLVNSVASAYDLLNSEGVGNHKLSPVLYSLVDDFTEETMNHHIKRIKESNFETLLTQYNLQSWSLLYEKVFGSKYNKSIENGTKNKINKTCQS